MGPLCHCTLQLQIMSLLRPSSPCFEEERALWLASNNRCRRQRRPEARLGGHSSWKRWNFCLSSRYSDYLTGFFLQREREVFALAMNYSDRSLHGQLLGR